MTHKTIGKIFLAASILILIPAIRATAVTPIADTRLRLDSLTRNCDDSTGSMELFVELRTTNGSEKEINQFSHAFSLDEEFIGLIKDIQFKSVFPDTDYGIRESTDDNGSRIKVSYDYSLSRDSTPIVIGGQDASTWNVWMKVLKVTVIFDLASSKIGTITFADSENPLTIVENNVAFTQIQNDSIGIPLYIPLGCDPPLRGDINFDGRIGLEEVVNALRKTAGVD